MEINAADEAVYFLESEIGTDDVFFSGKRELMTEPITVQVFDIIGGPLCVSTSDGQHLHDKIAPLLKEGTPVVLSFERVDILISAFLNAAVGQLYGELPEDRIRELLSVRNLAPDDLDMLSRVVENAKLYFSRSEDFDQAWQDELGDEEE